MVNVSELKAAIVRKGLTQKAVAKAIGISEQTFCRRMKAKAFGTDEAEKIAKLLEIQNPSAIFFDQW